MDEFLELLAIAAGVFVFLHAVSLIVMTSRLLKFQLWAPPAAQVRREEAGELLPVLDAGRAALEQQGFRYLFTRRTASQIASPSMPAVYSDVYDHPEHDVRAEVLPAALPTPRWPFDAYLWNSFTDGSALLTVNGLAHSLVTYSASTTIADAYAPGFPQQLAHHLQQRAALGRERTDPADALALSDAARKTMLPEMVHAGRGYLRDTIDSTPVYSLRLFAAIKIALRLPAGMKKRRAIDLPAKAGELGPDAPAEARVAAERYAFVSGLATLDAMRAPRWFRWSTLLLSAAAFLAVGAWWWGMSTTLVIGAVLAVHEAGHWLAMRQAGFRDVHVFFVPGMGAATSGEKHDATPLTHLAVYLAGPMPGLLLALLAFAWLMLGQADDTAWWFPTLVIAITASIVVNTLNLLPIMPLDGGRVVDLFVMGRLPWFRFLFALASGGLLVWSGVYTGDHVLTGLGAVVLLAVSYQYRLAKVSSDLSRQVGKAPAPAGEFTASAGQLYDFFSQPSYQKWDFTTKLGMGQAILPRFLGRLPGAKETLLGLMIYLACLAAPVVVVLAFAWSDPERFRALSPFDPGFLTAAPHSAGEVSERPRTESGKARLAAAKDSAERMEVLAALFMQAEEDADYDEQQALARLLYAETLRLPSPSRQHADAALKLASSLMWEREKKTRKEVAALLAEAEQTLRARLARENDGADALLLAQVLNARIGRNDPNGTVALRREVVALHLAHRVQSGQQLPLMRVALARSLDEIAEKAEAENELRLAVDDARRAGGSEEIAVSFLLLDHGWFLMSGGRPRAAVDRTKPLLSRPADAFSDYYGFDRSAQLLAAVAARSQGNWDEVKARTLPIHVLFSFILGWHEYMPFIRVPSLAELLA